MDALTLQRFRKVCGLLGSPHDGERAAAAWKATALLKGAGKTWGEIGFGSTTQTSATIWAAQVHSASAAADLYLKMLDSERARTTQMAEEINRLKREVKRLKGMWPKGKPKVAA